MNVKEISDLKGDHKGHFNKLKGEVKMSQAKKVNDFVSSFRNLSKDEQKEVMKKLIPKFRQIPMVYKSFVQEMMPHCMEMMKGMDFPMKEMMSKMMG